MSLKPISNRVVVQVEKPNNFTETGLEIIEAWQPDIMGTVISCGDGRVCDVCGTAKPMDVKPGDLVIFPYTTGQTVTIDGEERLVMRESDILAVVETSHDGTPDTAD